MAYDADSLLFVMVWLVALYIVYLTRDTFWRVALILMLGVLSLLWLGANQPESQSWLGGGLWVL
jgi:Na+/citrate or Na+/malate symporter